MKNRDLSSDKGFTLMEVLIAVSLLAVVMSMIYVTTNQSINAKLRVEDRMETYHAIRVSLDKISRDLSMAFLISGAKHFGTDGTSPKIKTIFRGEDNGSRDSVSFPYMGHLRLFQNVKESETAEVSYEVDDDPENEGLLRINRRESKILDNDPDAGGLFFPLVEKVKTFNLEYYDAKKKEWINEWNSGGDSQKGRLPRAVRITVGLQDPDNKEEELKFKTISMVEMYEDAIDF